MKHTAFTSRFTPATNGHGFPLNSSSVSISTMISINVTKRENLFSNSFHTTPPIQWQITHLNSHQRCLIPASMGTSTSQMLPVYPGKVLILMSIHYSWMMLRSGGSTEGISQSTTYLSNVSTGSLSTYNKAMDEIVSKMASERKPKTQKYTAKKLQYYIQKATEDCLLVCDGMAPNDGTRQCEAMKSADLASPDATTDDLVKTLLNAYKKATNISTKTRILSLYAYKYSVSTLKKLHSPHGKRARCHSRSLGPGSVPEQTIRHRVPIDMTKVDHFDQSAIFLSKCIIRNQIVKPRQQRIYWDAEGRACNDTVHHGQPVYPILSGGEVWTTQSFHVVQDSRSEGSLWEKVIARTWQYRRWWVCCFPDSWKDSWSSLARKWCAKVKYKPKDAKLYLKTGCCVHCNPKTAASPDHCRKFALSDEQDSDFPESCSHQHSETCDDCWNIRNALDEIENQIRGSSCNPYSNE